MNKNDAARIHKSLLAGIEKRLLVWMANRLPRWINPDHETAIGLFGAFLAGTGYCLTNWDKGFLWLSSFGLIINWLGDSLDGTLARVRKIERPVYGFYLDHNIDAITALIISIGAGVSPYISFAVVMLVLAGYYLLCIFTYINTILRGKFIISYSGLGPTELRLVIIAINTLIFFLPQAKPILEFQGLLFTFYDICTLAIALTIVVLYFFYFFTEKKTYGEIDPPTGQLG